MSDENLSKPDQTIYRMKTQIEHARLLSQSGFRFHSMSGPSAFTLVEMLVVISIMAILAALIIPTARIATEKKNRSAVEAELRQLEAVIDSYKDKLGYFPPDNTNNPAQPPLYYELVGTTNNTTGSWTLSGHESISKATIRKYFNMESFMNSAATEDDVKNFHTQIKPKQRDVNSDGVVFLTVPVKGPANPLNPLRTGGAQLNTWRYDSSSTNRHNLEGYDLWAEILIAGKTNIIGNWKR